MHYHCNTYSMIRSITSAPNTHHQQSSKKRKLCSESAGELQIAIKRGLVPKEKTRSVNIDGQQITAGKWSPLQTKGFFGMNTPEKTCKLILKGLSNSRVGVILPGRGHRIETCVTPDSIHRVIVDNMGYPVARLIKNPEDKNLQLQPFKQEGNYFKTGFLGGASAEGSKAFLKKHLIQAGLPLPRFDIFLHQFGNKKYICDAEGNVLAEINSISNKDFSIDSVIGDDGKLTNVILELMSNLDSGEKFTPEQFSVVHIEGKNYITHKLGKYIFELVKLKSSSKLQIISQNCLQDRSASIIDMPSLEPYEGTVTFARTNEKNNDVQVDKVFDHLAYALGLDRNSLTKYFAIGSFANQEKGFLFLRNYPKLPILELKYNQEKEYLVLDDIMLPMFNLVTQFPKHKYTLQGHEIMLPWVKDKYYKDSNKIYALLKKLTGNNNDTTKIQSFIQLHHTLVKLLEEQKLHIFNNIPIQENNGTELSTNVKKADKTPLSLFDAFCDFITFGLLSD